MAGRPPLHGLSVVTAAEIYPGPYATMLLADMGAEVIMLERPSGDPGRGFPAMFDALNRGKTSLALDVRTDLGRRLARELIVASDVFLEGSRPGVMDRLGLGASELLEQSPGLIYASMTAFGNSGPLASRPAHDLSVQAMAGLLEPGQDNAFVVPRVPFADLAVATHVVVGILAAVHRKAATGRGGLVEVSMLDALTSWQAADISPLLFGQEPARMPPPEPAYGCFATSDDRYVSVSITFNDEFWRRLCAVIGRDDIAGLSGPERTRRAEELRSHLAVEFLRRSAPAWEQLLEAADIPFALVETYARHARSVQAERRHIVRVDAVDPRRSYVGSPVRFDHRDPAPVAPAPVIGSHSLSILRSKGIAQADLDRAIVEGVLTVSPSKEEKGGGS